MIEKIVEKLKNKKIAILGFGREGKSSYRFIREYLGDVEITILDEKNVIFDDSNVVFVTGEHYLDHLELYDCIIKSPGISLKNIDISSFQDKITSQLELLLEVNRENIIGITGTKGKSTTTSLTYEVLKDQLGDVYLLGNIGVPVLDEIENYHEHTYLVIEMSSHQLEFVKNSPHIAAILNLYQDHLDHAGSLEHYHQNKMNIFKYQSKSDYSIYSEDNSYLFHLMKEYPYHGIIYTVRFDQEDGEGHCTRTDGKNVFIDHKKVYCDDQRNIIGNHNLKNIMFVLTIASILNLDMKRVHEVIRNFHGLKYRMEYIGVSQNIKFYNDTIATIPDATINAIEAIEDVDTLILGGLDRGIDYSEFIEYLRTSNVSNIICMPSTGFKIGKKLEQDKNILYVDTLEDAYQQAVLCTEKNKSCLLSPAAASYEYFKNFEEKGKAFETIVKSHI